MFETHKRSVMKAVSWRCIASVITATIVYLLTDREVLAVSAGLADSIIKILVYYGHERVWGLVPYGRLSHPLADLKFTDELKEADRDIIRRKLEELGYVHPS